MLIAHAVGPVIPNFLQWYGTLKYNIKAIVLLLALFNPVADPEGLQGTLMVKKRSQFVCCGIDIGKTQTLGPILPQHVFRNSM